MAKPKPPSTLRLESYVICPSCFTRVKPFITHRRYTRDKLVLLSIRFECPKCEQSFTLTPDAIQSADED